MQGQLNKDNKYKGVKLGTEELPGHKLYTHFWNLSNYVDWNRVHLLGWKTKILGC